MEPESAGERRMTFLIRLEESRGGLRGQVIAVGTGTSRLFNDLAGAVAFIEAQVRAGRDAEVLEAKNGGEKAIARPQAGRGGEEE